MALSPTTRLTATLFQLIEDATIADYYKQYQHYKLHSSQLVFDGQKIYFQNQEGLSFTSQLTLDQILMESLMVYLLPDLLQGLA